MRDPVALRGPARPVHHDVRDVWWFLAVLVATSAVFYLAGPVLGSLSGVTQANVPASGLSVVCPTIAAVVVAVRTGTGRQLLRWVTARPRGVIPWVMAIAALPTAVVASALLTGQGSGFEVPGVGALGLVVVFLVGALAEELGWTAFLLPRLLRLTGEPQTAVIIGSLYVLWHLVPDIQAGHAALWIVGHTLYSILFRVFIVQLTVHSGASVWPAVVAHAAFNLAWALSPDAGAGFDPWVMAALTAVIVAAFAVIRSVDRRRLA